MVNKFAMKMPNFDTVQFCAGRFFLDRIELAVEDDQGNNDFGVNKPSVYLEYIGRLATFVWRIHHHDICW